MAQKRIPINLLGVKLKQAREEKGLSIEEVAIELANLGISTKMIEDWENGFDIPKDELIRELSKLYGVLPNDFFNIKSELEFANKGKDNYHVKKYVGRTLWDIFGGFIIKIIKLATLCVFVFFIFKSGILGKIKDLFTSDVNNTEENYIVDDEYLRMLNSKHGTGKDYLNENSKHEAEKTNKKVLK